METPAYMIEVYDLHRSFGTREAVKGVSFHVPRGEIFGLLGPNGAGKSTTIRMLTGQINPTKGSASVAGCDVVKERARLKSRIGIVFDEPNLYERLSARMNLEFCCWLYGVPESRVDEVLDLVSLRDRAGDAVRAFSNGMKQRLLIARALLHHPPVLFLDEPSRGLDPIAAYDLRQTITRLSEEGMTVLLTPVILSIPFAGLSGLLAGQSNTVLMYNPQHSRLGQLVSQSFTGSQTVLASSPDEVASAFTASKTPSYTPGLIIPPGFDASLQRGEHPQVTVYFNNSQVTDLERQRVVTIITGYADGKSHALPQVIITPTTSLPATSLYTVDLSTFYLTLALLTSISVGISLVSTLLVEEKEKRTLRLLLVSPATITDVALAKLLVGVVYQLILSIVVLAVLHGFVGNLPLVLLFVLLSSLFGLALSLLAGSIFHTTSGLGGFLGIVSLLFIIPTVFASPLGAYFANAPLIALLHLLPTYYMASGLLDALQGQSMPGSTLLDIAITVSWTAAFLIGAILWLHRQTTITASI